MEIIKEHTSKDINCRVGVYDNSFSPFHWHENIEICRMLNKPGRFLIDGEIVCAKKGDIVVIGEQTVHQFMMEQEDTLVRIFHISPKALIGTGASIKAVQPHITAEELAAVPGLSGRIDSLLDIVEQDGGAASFDDSPYIRTIAASVYFLLMHHFPGQANTGSYKERQIFYKITEYVNSHFAEDISVQAVAKSLYMSRGKAGVIFAKYSGSTLSEYLNALRIRNVNKLIDEGVPITQAAYESGFQNIRTFNTVYKKIMNTTPSQYIKKL